MKMFDKCAMFTDIHFGRRNNSEAHNKDCLNFVEWFCEQVKNDPTIDHIMFLGDWFETRSAIDQETINYSQKAFDLLEALEMPIYMLVGNHDLYRKFSRDINSSNIFKEYNNLIIIQEPEVRPELHDSFLTPFLFSHEFEEVVKYSKYKTWFGHLELNDFYITGYYNVKMEHGADPKLFKDVDRIFTGHYHRRQSYNNIHYIGSPFGFDFSDIDDFDKGMATFSHITEVTEYFNYEEGAKFTQIKLTKLLTDLKAGTLKYPNNISIRCVLDMVLDYEKHMTVKDLIMKSFDVRELKFDDPIELRQSLMNADTEEVDILMENEDGELPELKELVIIMLAKIDTDKIDNDLLVKLYKEIT